MPRFRSTAVGAAALPSVAAPARAQNAPLDRPAPSNRNALTDAVTRFALALPPLDALVVRLDAVVRARRRLSPAPPPTAPRTLLAGPLPPGDRVANLDLLRAVAILLVVFSNAAIDLNLGGGRLATSGWMGVNLFFVLSGWLVGGLYWRELDRHGRVDVPHFWARRWLRTVPPYFVALGAVYAGKWWLSGGTQPFSMRYVVFAQNYADIPYWAVSWSLCVEEHFYLALPLVLGLALRIRGGVPALLAAAVAASLVARLLTVRDGDPLYGFHYTMTHMRMEGLALGVWAAYVRYRQPDAWPRLVRAARVARWPAVAVLATVPLWPVDTLNRFGFTTIDAAFAVLLVAVVSGPALPLAASAAVRWVAVTSYSVYMTHTVAFEIVALGAPGLPGAGRLAAGLALAAVLGVGFYAAVERPSFWLRERIAPSRRPPESRPPGRPHPELRPGDLAEV